MNAALVSGRFPGRRFDDFIAAVVGSGYAVLGPTVRNDTIEIDRIRSADDLPRGLRDGQSPGAYRLVARGDDAYFGFTTPLSSWKAHMFPARLTLGTYTPGEGFENAKLPEGRTALLGVRGCDLAAIRVHDRVLDGRSYTDPHYRQVRGRTLLVGVNCTAPSSSCFCTSTDCGPAIGAEQPADIILQELRPDDAEQHRFTAAAYSEAGVAVLERIEMSPVDEVDLAETAAAHGKAVSEIDRKLQTAGLALALKENPEHPRWQDVGDRCLSCGNCTMVCPTCFCVSQTDHPDPSGATDRVREWASCFELNHSYIHGGSVRSDTSARYRQWLTHKLSTWWDQFDTSGCVGCGRCITACPVGIDITVEAAAIAGSGPPAQSGPGDGSGSGDE